MDNILETGLAGNSGTRAISFALIGGEMVNIIYDARWMLLALIVCVLADFRYGWGESQKRYAEAKKNNDPIGLVKYSWHTSRAIRRTCNKLLDYFVWIAVGTLVGMAILAPIGLPYIYGGVATSAVAIFCEAKSFFGHFFYLHGVTIEQKSIMGFLRGLAIGFAKSKSPDIGEGLEQGFREYDKGKDKAPNH